MSSISPHQDSRTHTEALNSKLKAMLSQSLNTSASTKFKIEQIRTLTVCFYSQNCSPSEIHGPNRSSNASLRLTMIISVYWVSSQRRDRPLRSNQSPREASSSSMEATQRPHVTVYKALSTSMILSHEGSSNKQMRMKNSSSWNPKWNSKMKSISFHH